MNAESLVRRAGNSWVTELYNLLGEVFAAQDLKLGELDYPDGTGVPGTGEGAEFARRLCYEHDIDGTLTWRHILSEAFHVALAEADPVKLRAELIKVAAVAVAWVMAIDRRQAKGAAA